MSDARREFCVLVLGLVLVSVFVVVARTRRFGGDDQTRGVDARDGNDGDADSEKRLGNGVEQFWIHHTK